MLLDLDIQVDGMPFERHNNSHEYITHFEHSNNITTAIGKRQLG